ncbi:Mitogen-activated protein kinase kinase kinase NPK1 [Acorus calamus]|uniref:Mitogen-activated protein kinase kinase kinase NPK1 n=1 Tax=Acorus calamus TaxID=4465 RepID=A0AAV9F7D6_ACOCL|nr:Mitogen-activated protein kinase kinase kinase NPK1 [Acorus calamus]
MGWVRGNTLGRGAFATVNAVSNGHDPLMAVKSAPLSESSSLRHEKSVLTLLQGCPHIIGFFGDDVTTERDGRRRYNLLLEYAQRGSLHDLIHHSSHGIPESVARRYARSLLLGLRHVHASGFVHCDVKPQNVLVFDDDRVKIADFGLTRKSGLRGDSGYCGTPLYMAPESVLRGEHGPPSDVWAFGCVVAEMVSGETVWPSMEVEALLFEIGCGLPKIPEMMSKQGKDFLSKCLVREPEERWTAEMLRFVTEEYASGGCTCAVYSPKSVFDNGEFSDLSTGDVELDGYATTSDSSSAVDRMQQLANTRRPDWLGDDWILVRGADESPVFTSEEDQRE